MLTIKDLSASKALDHKALTEVRGGSNFALQGGALVGNGGINVASPQTVINAPTAIQNDNDLGLNLFSVGAANLFA